MKTEPKNYTVRDGIIRRYEPLTIREAFALLADQDAPLCAFRDGFNYDWSEDSLEYIKPDDQFPFVGSAGYRECARIVEIDPRAVPDGVPALPEPWMAYVGRKPDGRENNIEEIGVFHCCGLEDYDSFHEWIPVTAMNLERGFYAIDTLTEFARNHYPEYVEAVGYVEPQECSASKIERAIMDVAHKMSMDNSAMDNMRIVFEAGRAYEKGAK
jgi:hypothetical protein